MERVLDFFGFVGAWLGLLGWRGLGLVVIAALVIYGTRKRAGRRYDKQAPGRAEAQIDTWHWSG